VRPGKEFFNFYNHGFVRLAIGVPIVRVADPEFNAGQTIALMERAAEMGAALVLFPELGLSAYTCEDLFHQKALQIAVRAALERVVEATRKLPVCAVVGFPLEVNQLLYNCAAVVASGRILGVIPKTYLPGYREFYEPRYFTPANAATATQVDLVGQRDIPFGTRLLFHVEQEPLFKFFVEICEDVWVPIPPSSHAALAGATVILNLSASNITIGKADYRRQLVKSQSARCLSAYLYSASGFGESTTDLAWDGHAFMAENGRVLAESERFLTRPQIIASEIDVEHLAMERMRQTTFGQAAMFDRSEIEQFRSVEFSLELPTSSRLLLSRTYERFPYVPSDTARRDERCREVFQIQVQGLAKRLQSAGIERVVIGVSGGLDSAHALLVCAQCMDQLGYPRTNILAYTMPGFATSRRTLEQARSLMQAIGCKSGEIDIRPSCELMLRDIGHPYANGKPVYDVTFENVQAGERTSHLFRLANLHGGLVVGTGDLSELAAGWCTYGVGDHMSHYAVNASVPKTLMGYVIRWVAETGSLGPAASEALFAVLATKVSPELAPGKSEDEPSQDTEATIGPYDLLDFYLYFTLRFGYPPPKTAFLAWSSWRDQALGSWPDIPEDKRRAYDIAEIKQHLRTFLMRFFKYTQFKRSCIPNAPKIGSGGSLSPRGDYRAPSDSEAVVWLEELELVPETEPSGILEALQEKW
jgi:NAD+ synthase (glutamine-hydrolysing)